MSLIAGHQPCEKCGSSDALAIYSDAEKCFSCGYRKKVNSHSLFDIPKRDKLLPNLSYDFPKEALVYLLKYRIFQADIIDAGIRWNPIDKRIMYPISDTAWQGRTLSNSIKYITYGDKTYKLFGNGDIVVLCEDWLSSYRVSKVPGLSSVCLFGTSCQSTLLLKLIKNNKKVVIWLDGDKPGVIAAEKIKKSLELYYPVIYNVSTVKDPKTYSNQEIQDIIYERVGIVEGGTK